jgi:DNA helicase HerA-like ATPase
MADPSAVALKPDASAHPFIFPGAADKTVVIGATGSGKTIFAAWLLAHQRLDVRPWVILDFKHEEFWDRVGSPPIRRLAFGDMPGKLGLYRMNILPGQDEGPLDEWLWRIWRHGDIGLFIDEAALIPRGSHPFKAILRQGRSRRVPVIAATQRPVDVEREVFSETQYKSIFSIEDERDYKIIQGFTRRAPIDRPLPRRWSYWYDGLRRRLLVLKPVPPPSSLAADLRAALPRRGLFG